MRLAARLPHVPQEQPAPTKRDPGRKRIGTYNPFDCQGCMHRGEWNEDQRYALRCTRAGYQGDWSTSPVPPITEYLGREPLKEVPERERDYIPDHFAEIPPEDWAEGCPGGWLANGFISALSRYFRPVGDYALPNPLVHAGTDEFILECLREYEHHRAIALKEFQREVARGR